MAVVQCHSYSLQIKEEHEKILLRFSVDTTLFCEIKFKAQTTLGQWDLQTGGLLKY